MSIESLSVFAEPLKIVGSAAAGAIATLFATRWVSTKKKVLEVDLVHSAKIGGIPESIGVNVTFESQSYNVLQFSFVEVRNKGLDAIENVELVFWLDGENYDDWFIKVIGPNGRHRCIKEYDIDGKYLIAKLDYLNPGQKEEFAIASKYVENLEVSSRTKGAIFVDARERREKAEKIGSFLMRIARPF